MADQRLRVILELLDKLSPGMKNASSNVANLGKQANTTTTETSLLDKAMLAAGTIGRPRWPGRSWMPSCRWRLLAPKRHG